MEFQKLTAEVRTGRRKGTARQLRRNGRVPAVCYGPDRTPLVLSVDPKALGETLRGPLGRNAVIEMSVTGEGAPPTPLLVMLQDAQHHPIDRSVLHVDFLTVSAERKVRVEVPLLVEGRPIGVQAGGVLSQIYRTLPVRCSLDAIPAQLTLDASGVDLGGTLRVADLKLPEGIVVEFDANQTLVSVNAPKAVAEEVTEAEAEEGAEPAKAEEGGEKAAEAKESEGE
jgi:large subunit ribosomal protein L25